MVKRKCPYCGKGGLMTYKQYVAHYRSHHSKRKTEKDGGRWAKFRKPGKKRR